MRRLLLAVLAVTLLPAASDAADDPTASEIRRLLDSGGHPTMRFGRIGDVGDDARRFYEARGFAPAWLADGHATDAAREMIARFAASDTLGLDPDAYDGVRLGNTARSYADGRAPDAREAARFDLAVTCDAMRYVEALRFGRVSPHEAHGTLDLPRPPEDRAARVDSLTHPDWIAPVLLGVQPRFRHYRLLVEGLAQYRKLERDSVAVHLPGLPRKLAPGDRLAPPTLADLRGILEKLGDVPDSLAALPPPARDADTLYDATLVAAVKGFQARNGLDADGVVGSATAQRLQRSFGERIRQIELTLERWRWLPRDYSAPPIFVNIPAFRLHAFRTLDDDETTMLSMDVVVGKAYEHDTPVFTAPMKYIVFRPYWEVPTSIATAEIRPKASRDPSYLARERFVLVGSGGNVPATAANIQAIGRGVRVRQRPGADNSLGSVKFMLPNPYNIYLHDTPSQGKFGFARRDFSHGCIRLSEPAALAEFILRDQPEWDAGRIAKAMAADEPTQVYLKTPLPVYIVYGTAVVRQNGKVYFYPDLYGHDQELAALLARGYPYGK